MHPPLGPPLSQEQAGSQTQPAPQHSPSWVGRRADRGRSAVRGAPATAASPGFPAGVLRGHSARKGSGGGGSNGTGKKSQGNVKCTQQSVHGGQAKLEAGVGGLAPPRGTTLNFSKARIIQKWMESALCAAVPAWQVGTGAFARCPPCGLFMGGGSWNQGHVCVESQLHPAPQAGCLPEGRGTVPNSGRGPVWVGMGTASCSDTKNTRNGIQQTCRIRTSIFPLARSRGRPSGLAGPLAHRRPQGPRSFPSPCSANFDAGSVFGLATRWLQ